MCERRTAVVGLRKNGSFSGGDIGVRYYIHTVNHFSLLNAYSRGFVLLIIDVYLINCLKLKFASVTSVVLV